MIYTTEFGVSRWHINQDMAEKLAILYEFTHMLDDWTEKEKEEFFINSRQRCPHCGKYI